MPLINVNRINLYVNVQGRGYPVILIHGIGGDYLSHFKNVYPALSEDFKTIGLDCRGHGKSDKPASSTLQDHADDILGIMGYFGIETSYLLGVSAGSYIAQLVAISEPERVNKLVLTVTKSNGLTPSVQRLFKEHAGEIEGLDVNQSMSTLLKYMVFDPDLMKNHPEAFNTKLTPEQFASASRTFVGFDFRNDLAKIKAKTLVISGKYDGLNPPDNGREVTSLIPNARFVEMQYSGHAPIYEEPETYVEIVRSFLLTP